MSVSHKIPALGQGNQEQRNTTSKVMKKTKAAIKGNNPQAVFHGECFLFQSALPDGAVEVEHNTPAVIIANSEVTGNHHVIDRGPGVKFFKSADGKSRFMQNEEPTKVRCVLAERHSAIDLAPGVWEFGIAEEYDYKAESKRKVAD